MTTQRSLFKENVLFASAACVNDDLNRPEFAEKLSIIIDANGGIQRARRLILDLAVRGRLVPRSRSEGRGADLLSALRSEVGACRGQWLEPQPRQIASDAGYDAPESWSWVRLSNIVIFGPKNGYSPKAVGYLTATRTLALTATTSGRFNGQHYKYIDETIPEESYLWLQDGDVLIQRSNSLEHVGMAAVYRGKSREYIYPDLMMKVRLSASVDADYVHRVLLASPTRSFVRARASGTAGSMPKISQTVVANIPIPLPPYTEQKRIVAKVDQLMALCDDLEAKLRVRDEKAAKLAEALVAEVLA
ncbi:restriction endonuclease subunit S [Sorangium sp. So ce726]|uniref:restriction endonuclease subunit S n=1 Tax=Sorangium sp. So ce726 TaxID=3133319 RepID=UPI003F643351